MDNWWLAEEDDGAEVQVDHSHISRAAQAAADLPPFLTVGSLVDADVLREALDMCAAYWGRIAQSEIGRDRRDTAARLAEDARAIVREWLRRASGAAP